jgi:hypothetical protein
MPKSNRNSLPDQTPKKRSSSLTVAKIRRYPGNDNFSDQQAVQAVDAIEKLSNCFFICSRMVKILIIKTNHLIKSFAKGG